MTRENVHVGTSTEPKNAKRKFETTVVGFYRVGDIAILMGPIGGIRERSGAENDETRLIFDNLSSF